MLQLLEDIARPISDSAPSGEDIARLSPTPENEEWIRIYADLRELTNRAASNCESIVSLSQSILTEKSKDLRIAGYLCLGLMHQRGFSGLAEGLKVYRLLLEEYWDRELYPSRDVARASNVKSLDGRLGKDVSARSGDNEYFIPASPEDAEAMEEIRQTAEAIGVILNEKVPGKAGSMDELIMAVTARSRGLGTAAKKPESVTKSVSPLPRQAPARVTPAQQETTVTVPAEEGAISAIRNEVDALRIVIRAADFLFRKDPKSVVPYRLLRSGLWYSLPLFDPEPNRSGKRVTQYLPPAGRAELEQLLKDEEWESLIAQCEAAFTQRFESGYGGCFSLDIQRFLTTAVKELIKKADEGGDRGTKEAYEAVNKLILQETAILVERYPWITDLFYADETPFVDSQTRSWIEKSVKPVLTSGSKAQQGSTEAGSSTEGGVQISQDFEQAMDLLSRQKWGDAVDLLQKGINADPTRKGRFQRRLNLASLCLDAGQPVMARPLLEQLDEEIERFSLDEWEPGLCVQVWNYLKRCYQELMSQQGADGLYREKADKIFEKICRLDIRAALTGEA